MTYKPGTPPPGDYARYLDEELNRIASEVALASVEDSGVGGIRLGDAVPFADLGVAWQKINVYDIESITVPIKVEQSIDDDTLTPLSAGVWLGIAMIQIDHNKDSSLERFTSIRFYNETKAEAGREFIMPAVRNMNRSKITISGIFDVPPANIGDAFRIEIGNGNIYTDVVFRYATFEVVQVSEQVASAVAAGAAGVSQGFK